MKLVVKIGGAALDDKEVVSKFAKTIPRPVPRRTQAGDRSRRRRGLEPDDEAAWL